MLSSAAFDSINSLAGADSISVWTAEEEHARRERVHDVTVMDIYDIKMERRAFDLSTLDFLDSWFQFLLGPKYF